MNLSEQQVPDFNFGTQIPPVMSSDLNTDTTSCVGVIRKSIPISNIVKDPDLQLRARMDQYVVKDYAEAMQQGATFPPVTVFEEEDGNYLLADGWHTLEAAVRNGHSEIIANVRSGGKRDAVEYAAGANANHGHQRTNEDKRRAARSILNMHPDWSNRQIATVCKISDVFVGKIRTRIEERNNITTNVRVGSDGISRKMPEKKRIAPPKVQTIKNDTPVLSDISEIDFSKPCEELIKKTPAEAHPQPRQVSTPAPFIPATGEPCIFDEIEIKFNGKIIFNGHSGAYICFDEKRISEALKIIQAKLQDTKKGAQ